MNRNSPPPPSVGPKEVATAGTNKPSDEPQADTRHLTAPSADDVLIDDLVEKMIANRRRRMKKR